MNRLLLWRMLQEEVRLNSSFASRRGFWFFPLLVVSAGLLGTVLAAELIADIPYGDVLLGLHFSFLFYGLFTGGLAFFSNDFLERIFGHYALVTSLPETQPISYQRVMGIYFTKELVFYAIFTFIPLILGAILGTNWSFITPERMLRLMASLLPSFGAGLAATFLVASLYRRSIYWSIIGGSVMLLLLGIVLQAGELPQITWYLANSPPLVLIWGAVLFPATIATFIVGEFQEQTLPPVQGYREQYAETLANCEWSRRWAIPAVVAKERLDLQRSRTGIKMLFSFAVPLTMLVFVNWFLDRGLPLEIEFNTIFWGVMVGFFGTMLYSWLNTMDDSGFYATLPIQVPDLIHARLMLFSAVTWWIPVFFMGLIALISRELGLLPLAILVMAVVGIYVVSYTAWITGLHTNSSLYDVTIFARFFLVSVPPMVLLAILSMALQQNFGIILIALSFVCLILLMATLVFYKRIEVRWAREELG